MRKLSCPKNKKVKNSDDCYNCYKKKERFASRVLCIQESKAIYLDEGVKNNEDRSCNGSPKNRVGSIIESVRNIPKDIRPDEGCKKRRAVKRK